MRAAGKIEFVAAFFVVNLNGYADFRYYGQIFMKE